MRFYTEHLVFNTKQHRQYINITADVNKALNKSGIQEGMILVSAMHITAGVWVDDAEDGLLVGIDECLKSWRLTGSTTATTELGKPMAIPTLRACWCTTS